MRYLCRKKSGLLCIFFLLPLAYFWLGHPTRANAIAWYDEYYQSWDNCATSTKIYDCDTADFGSEYWDTHGLPNYIIDSTSNTAPNSAIIGGNTWAVHEWATYYHATSSVLVYDFVQNFDAVGGYANTWWQTSFAGIGYYLRWTDGDGFDLYDQASGGTKLADHVVNAGDWFRITWLVNCEDSIYTFLITEGANDYEAEDQSFGGCDGNMQTGFGPNYPGTPYTDDITVRVFGSVTEYNLYLSSDKLQWAFPVDGGSMSNAPVNSTSTNWNLLYDTNTFNAYDNIVLAVYVLDSRGNTHYDYDENLATTTGLTSWYVPRTYNLPDGKTYARAILFGVTGTDCDSGGCLRTDLAWTPTIDFTVSADGDTIYDLGQTGYTPATTTEEYSFLESIILPGWSKALGKIKWMFPFSLAENVNKSWDDADTYVIPPQYAWMDVVASSGDVTLEVMPSWGAGGQSVNVNFGSSTYTAIGSQSETMDGISVKSRTITGWIFQILFLLYLAVRAYRGYNHWSHAHQPDV